jgi:hypothetical protein
MCTGHDHVVGPGTVAGLSRRGFLRTAVTTAAVVGTSGALAGPALAQEEAGGEGRGRHRVPPSQISIQLFTLRDQLAIDLEGTLQALRDIGYTRVEHAGFVGRTVEEFKAALDAAGLWASSGHVPIPSLSTRLPGARRWPTPTRWDRASSCTRSSGRLRDRGGGADHGAVAGVRA